MEAQTAYARIAQKTDEQEPHTAPRAEDGDFAPKPGDDCSGCGVFTFACTQESSTLHRHERSSITFETPRMLDEALAQENRE